MPPLLLLGIQIASSFVVLGLFAATVVAPRLDSLSPERALQPLLWVHTMRYVPLALLAPGQTGPGVPPSVARTIAWGDFASAAFAVAAIVALRARGAGGLSWVRAFIVVSSLDIVIALTLGLYSGVHEQPLGVGWYVLTLYVPIVCITQVMIARPLFGLRAPARGVAP
jgi:hypothetical protein